MPDNELININSREAYIYILCSVGCVTCAALAAGMTVGLLSLDSLKLKIKIEVGTPSERIAANKILPLISNHHLLLCTLLLFNALANEALPIFLDALVPSWAAIAISVTLVLMFGEVIPSALFTGPHQLQIASRFTGLVYFLEIIFYPIAFPLAKILDNILGHEDDDVFNRDEISAMVRIFRNKGSIPFHEYIGDFRRSKPESIQRDEVISSNEVDVITGVLGLSKLLAKDICIPMERVVMLSSDQVLNQETIDKIDMVGYSRLPVFLGRDATCIIGYLIVKRLINVNPEKATPLSTIALNEPVVVGANQSLLDILKIFQAGARHMALVSEKPKELLHSIKARASPSKGAAPIGIITVEDVFERMIQQQIYDEEDNEKSMHEESASQYLREMSFRSTDISTISRPFDHFKKMLQETTSSGNGSRTTSKNGKSTLNPMSEPFLVSAHSSQEEKKEADSAAYSFLPSRGLTSSLVASFIRPSTSTSTFNYT